MRNLSQYIISVMLLFYLCSSPVTYAQNVKLDTINLNLSGVVTEKTCGVLSTEQDKYISLGTIRVGKGMLQGDRSLRVKIPFSLSSCPTNANVTITFDGAYDLDNHELLAIDNLPNKAKNVAIEITDKDKKRLILGKKSDPIKTDANGNALVDFYASYLVTQADAEPGKANAKMQFSVEYE